MIRYSTSNDKVCKVIRDWCRRNNYIFSFEDTDNKANEVYPFVILASSKAEKELMELISTYEI
ncbi:MAG: hypothetical protein IJI66_02575 [Erysipelotrichaceae bacterium]|nr:hypothetical protein [Erysipelotrichaceae bacterium]